MVLDTQRIFEKENSQASACAAAVDPQIATISCTISCTSCICPTSLSGTRGNETRAEQPAREAVTRTAAWHIHTCKTHCVESGKHDARRYVQTRPGASASASWQRGTGRIASVGVLGPVIYSTKASGQAGHVAADLADLELFPGSNWVTHRPVNVNNSWVTLPSHWGLSPMRSVLSGTTDPGGALRL